MFTGFCRLVNWLVLSVLVVAVCVISNSPVSAHPCWRIDIDVRRTRG
jgi:hypothetical protein